MVEVSAVGNDRGLRVEIDKASLRELGVYERLLDGEEISLLFLCDPDLEMGALRETEPTHPNASILRLRSDGVGEAVFISAVYGLN